VWIVGEEVERRTSELTTVEGVSSVWSSRMERRREGEVGWASKSANLFTVLSVEE
jgi:hypothetical protein